MATAPTALRPAKPTVAKSTLESRLAAAAETHTIESVRPCVLAIRPKTGEIACYFQYTPNDVYDVDGVDEHVLADIEIDGQPRQVLIQANKNGFLYVLDRTNCELLAAESVCEGQLGHALRF